MRTQIPSATATTPFVQTWKAQKKRPGRTHGVRLERSVIRVGHESVKILREERKHEECEGRHQRGDGTRIVRNFRA